MGKGSILGWGLLLRFAFLVYKKFLCFIVCCIFNRKRKFIKSFYQNVANKINFPELHLSLPHEQEVNSISFFWASIIPSIKNSFTVSSKKNLFWRNVPKLRETFSTLWKTLFNSIGNKNSINLKVWQRFLVRTL